MKKKRTPNRTAIQQADACLLTQPQSFLVQEAYRTLRTSVMFALPGSQCKCIGITSASPGDGKSTTASNLAISLAQIGKKVILIDSDMRLPTIAAKFQVKSAPGLSDLLVGQAQLENVIIEHEQCKLDLLPSGNIPPDPTGLLEAKQLESLFSTLRDTYEYIIVDLPPVVSVSDALILSKYMDGFLLVVREQQTHHRDIKEMMRQLELAGAKVIGFVLSGSNINKGKKYTYKYGK